MSFQIAPIYTTSHSQRARKLAPEATILASENKKNAPSEYISTHCVQTTVYYYYVFEYIKSGKIIKSSSLYWIFVIPNISSHTWRTRKLAPQRRPYLRVKVKIHLQKISYPIVYRQQCITTIFRVLQKRRNHRIINIIIVVKS